MGRATTNKKTKPKGKSKGARKKATPAESPVRRVIRWAGFAFLAPTVMGVLWIVLYIFVNPPTTPYILSESRRLDGVDRQWVDLDEISPHLARAVIAAEDANFCLHWGFDVAAIREALDDGAGRGASTISQQVVKNTFLWHGRSWFRKALEAVMTPLVEILWTKKRIMEVYLNVAEFDEGIFGAEAAARNAFGVGPDALKLWQAARLAAVLPSPKRYSASNPSGYVRGRASAHADGAETIRVDGRAECISAS